jgi:predicted ATPase with chaperone activity
MVEQRGQGFDALAVAWALADLAGRDSPSRDDVTAASSYRQA